MTDKEIIIDGIKYFKQSDINKGLDEEHYVTEFHLLATHYNLLLEDYARKYNRLKEQLKRKEQELQAQRNFTTQEQRKIYCVAYDKTCETGNECKQKKCVFKDRLKYKQALDEIEEFCTVYSADHDAYETVYKDILAFINKTKGGE